MHMEFKQFEIWTENEHRKNVFFSTDKDLSGKVEFSKYSEPQLGIIAHRWQWGKFNPYLFVDDVNEGAPDKETCDEVMRIFERDKHFFEEQEEKLVELHDKIERAYQQDNK